MIIPIYQPLGSSSHQLAKIVGIKNNQKATHTGTLDPMAEGVLVVLTGEDRLRKSELSDVHKAYKFEILWGIETDSIDSLGLVINHNQVSLDQVKDLQNCLDDFIGPQYQTLPKFSAKRIGGETYFDLAKRGEEFHQASQEIEIYGLRHINTRKIGREQLQIELEGRLELLNNERTYAIGGDFRQEEILEAWREFFATSSQEEFLISGCEAEVSKRTYVRGLVRDIAGKLSLPATTFSILRSKNGPYFLENCICIIP